MEAIKKKLSLRKSGQKWEADRTSSPVPDTSAPTPSDTEPATTSRKSNRGPGRKSPASRVSINRKSSSNSTSLNTNSASQKKKPSRWASGPLDHKIIRTSGPGKSGSRAPSGQDVRGASTDRPQSATSRPKSAMNVNDADVDSSQFSATESYTSLLRKVSTHINNMVRPTAPDVPVTEEINEEGQPKKPKVMSHISYYHSTSEDEFCAKTIGDLLKNCAEKFPDRECLVFCEDNVRRTFKEFYDECQTFAACLLGFGLRKGDKIAIWCTNTVEWAVTFFASALMGAVTVPINPSGELDEIEFALKNTRCKCLVFSKKLHSEDDNHRILAEIIPELKHSRPGELDSRKLPFMKTVIITSSDLNQSGTYRYEDVARITGLNRMNDLEDIAKNQLNFDDIANIQFTSGTSGWSKAVSLTHHSLVNNIMFAGTRLGFHDGTDRVCVQFPFFSSWGISLGLLCMVAHGTCLIFPSSFFNVNETIRCLHRENITALCGYVSTVSEICKIVDRNNEVFVSLEKVLIAGMACSEDDLQRMEGLLGVEIQVAYGCSELSPIVAMTEQKDSDRDMRIRTVGTLLPHMEVMILEEGTFQPTDPMVAGEVAIRGYNVMLEYWNNLQATDEVFTQATWYRTGDRGILHPGGYLQIIGPIRDMIKLGDESADPVEIERVIRTYDPVVDAQVVGLPNREVHGADEEVAAFVIINPEETVEKEDIKKFCHEWLNSSKVPKHIEYVEIFPMTESGKVQKYKIQKYMKKKLATEAQKIRSVVSLLRTSQ